MKEILENARDYQKAILKTCIEKDCLVILPTGTGKTLIAIMLSVERFKKFPLEKVVILAPTRPLVEQHLESFKKTLPEGFADMQVFTGKTEAEKRKEIWKTAEFIFSTPQCIANDLKKKLYDLSDVNLLVIDECHRCLKNYSYNHVVQTYKEQGKNKRVLGLTASPGSDKKTIEELCQNMGISAVEIRTRESEDVKPYLQKLEFEKIEVDFPPRLQEIRLLLNGIFDEKTQELKNYRLLFGHPSKIAILKLQAKLMNELKRGNDYTKMLAVSACSQALKISHAIELLETQTVSSFIAYLKGLFSQAEAKKSRGVQKLVKDSRFARAYSLATTLEEEHPKVKRLKEIVKEKLDSEKNSKIIIFAQFRETVLKISEVLNEIEGVKAKTFVGQLVKEHGAGRTTGLNQKEQKKAIEEFKEGKFNCLIATSIAEEGLDIPEVSEVIFYEPVPSAIRKIQRAGRTARLSRGSLKILITKDTRDQIYHYAAYHKEKRMHSAIGELKEDLEKGEKQKTLDKI